jgi:hypothetical protein
MGGPPLYPGSLLNIYTGGSERGLRRVVVRADPCVARVRVHLASGAPLELPPLATRPDVGVSLFATLLPQAAECNRNEERNKPKAQGHEVNA